MKVILEASPRWKPGGSIERLVGLLSPTDAKTVLARSPRDNTEQFSLLLGMVLKKLSIGTLRYVRIGPQGCRMCFRLHAIGGMTAIPLLLKDLPVGSTIYRVDWLGRKRERIVVKP